MGLNLEDVDLLAELGDEPSTVQAEAQKETKRKGQEDPSARKKQKSGGSKSTYRGPLGPRPEEKTRSGGQDEASKGKGVAEGSGKSRLPKPFRPSFHSTLLKRELTEEDSVFGEPRIAPALLKGIRLQRDLALFPKDRPSLGVAMLGKLAQVGQLASVYCDAVHAEDAAKAKEILKARDEAQSLRNKLIALGKEKEEADALVATLREKAEVEEGLRKNAENDLLNAKNFHQHELQSAVDSAKEEGQREAINFLKPQVKSAMEKGMAQGWARGYQQALTLCHIPAEDKIWEVPPTPKYVSERTPKSPKQPTAGGEEVNKQQEAFGSSVVPEEEAAGDQVPPTDKSAEEAAAGGEAEA